MGHHADGRSKGLAQWIDAAWNKVRGRRNLARDLASLESNELERIAHEFGMTRSELCRLARLGPASADLLYRRLAEKGIDPKLIEPAALQDLQRSCSNCDSKKKCSRELENQAEVASWPKYCPNELTIHALQSMRCH